MWNSIFFNSPVRFSLLLLLPLVFAACAVAPAQTKTVKTDNTKRITLDQTRAQESDSAFGWWNVGFHRPYESDEDVMWHMDAFIALKILKPILEEHKDLSLWRFHRRAVNDKSGHNFSLKFYATREVGEAIYQQINKHPLVAELLQNNYIERLSFYNINGDLRSAVEATSDSKWPIELQKSWPYFIMGVSRTWLDLVGLFYQDLELSPNANLDEQIDGFKKVSADIDLVWKHNGSHAFFHHLNALFAYQELYVIESQLRRF